MIEIREATDSERERARDRWVKIISPPKAASDPIAGPMHRAPHYGHTIGPSTWRVGARAIVDKTLGECAMLVAVSPAVPTEPVGWVAYEGDRLHMVYVMGDARRRGVGRALVEHAMMGKRPRVTYCTKAGRELLATIARTTACSVDSEHATARPPMDVQRGSPDLVDC